MKGNLKNWKYLWKSFCNYFANINNFFPHFVLFVDDNRLGFRVNLLNVTWNCCYIYKVLYHNLTKCSGFDLCAFPVSSRIRILSSFDWCSIVLNVLRGAIPRQIFFLKSIFKMETHPVPLLWSHYLFFFPTIFWSKNKWFWRLFEGCWWVF